MRPPRIGRPKPAVLAFALWSVASLSFSASRTVSFACGEDLPPFSSAEGGRLEGFDIELVRELSAAAGFSSELVSTERPARAIRPDLSGADAVPGMVKTPGRAAFMDFSVPYLQVPYALFAGNGSGIRRVGGLGGKRLVLFEDDADIEEIAALRSSGSAAILVGSYAEAFHLIADGRADYTIAPASLGALLAARYGGGRVWRRDRPLFSVFYRFAVARGDASLLSSINDALLDLERSGFLARERAQRRFRDPFGAFPVIAIPGLVSFFAAIAAAACAAAITVLLFSLRKAKARAADAAASCRRFEAILEAVPFPLFWTDERPAPVGSNASFRVSESPGRESDELALAQSALSSAAVREKDCETADGRSFRNVAAPVRLGDGRLCGAVIALEDRTEASRLLSELRDTERGLAEARARLAEDALVDRLTGCFERDAFIRRCAVSSVPVECVLVSFGGLSEANRMLGRAAVDAFIAEAASRLREACRSRGFCGRVSPALFALALARVSPNDDEDNAAAKLLHGVSAPPPASLSIRSIGLLDGDADAVAAAIFAAEGAATCA